MKMILCLVAVMMFLLIGCTNTGVDRVKLVTVDPGHFHAALVQKFMYPQVDPVVKVYAPDGADVNEHLKRIDGFNTRKDNPTAWKEEVYRGPDFFAKMIAERPGNVIVLSGNNAKKTQYILQSVEAGFNVLADKPMAINPENFEMLRAAFDKAAEKKVLLYDIMTERFEICTMLQRDLSRIPSVFGQLQNGTPDQPAVTKESVHHFSKMVAGNPLKRPAWFFDVTQQGEGIVDVTTHLVDLIQWECFPEQIIDCKDVKIQTARRWATTLSPEQFKKVTGMDSFPDYLKKDVSGSDLNVYSNGEINYTLRGVRAKVSVTWNFEAPAGAGDTHFSTMRGTRCNLVIKQGKEQGYKPMLYVERAPDNPEVTLDWALREAVASLNAKYPGISVQKTGDGWQIMIPDSYYNGHEAHFAQVTQKYLKCLQEGKLPAWEVPNMIAKYYTTTTAYKMSR